MKKMKKLVGILLTLAMVVAMSITTFAEENGTTPSTTSNTTQYTIAAPNNGHTYEIYQIFTGDVSGNVLSNVKWGANGKYGQGAAVGDSVLTELNGLTGSDKEKLTTIEEKYVNLNSKPYKKVQNGETTVEAGYYLIKDKNGTLEGTDDTYTLYIVKVCANLIIEPKAEKPSSEKKVKDINDSTGQATDWIDSADYDIGDKVPFQLKGTVASDYANYEQYKFVFHDQESAGLTFDVNSVKVYVDGTQITSGYTVTTSTTDGDTFDVTFANLKEINSVQAGSVITVEYESTLNDKAVIGSAGNPNEMYLEYSNNPNNAQGGETGKTPKDKVIVFTYKLDVNKVGEDGETPLSGAEFKLEKKVKTKDGESWSEIAVSKNTEGTIFTFKGLDDGVYKLSETQTPAGYNTIEDIEFTVSATHEENSADPKLTGLTGKATNGVLTFTATKVKDAKGHDTDQVAGELSTTVQNKKGTTLPETGGMGTTILYVVGAILVIGAGILLVTKKRMNANK
mgnify:CR=1 FL=1